MLKLCDFVEILISVISCFKRNLPKGHDVQSHKHRKEIHLFKCLAQMSFILWIIARWSEPGRSKWLCYPCFVILDELCITEASQLY